MLLEHSPGNEHFMISQNWQYHPFEHLSLVEAGPKPRHVAVSWMFVKVHTLIMGLLHFAGNQDTLPSECASTRE
jgi:hypothetical protein